MRNGYRGRLESAAALLFLGFVHSSAAFSGQWESVGINVTSGPTPPSVQQVAFTVRGLVTATRAGVYRSRADGGWDQLLQVLNLGAFPGPLPFGFGSVEMNPQNPNVFLAGMSNRGIYRSADGGSSWDYVVDGSGVAALAIAPSDASIAYASILTPSLRTSAMYRSADGGATWTRLTALGPSLVHALAVDPSSSDTLYASVVSPGGLAAGVSVSRDGGQTWNPANAGLPSDTVAVLAADPTASGVVYAGTSTSGVFRTGDGGATWSAVNQDLGDLRVSALAIDPRMPSVVYAGTFRGVYRSEDSGGHWLPIGLHDAKVYTLAVDPASPSTVYAGIAGGLERITLGPTTPCVADAATMCLNGGRFRVQASYRTATMKVAAAGQALPISDVAGGFTFFDPSNVEVVLKVLDGTAVNGDFWVLYAVLSTVEYSITVTDTATGAIQSYANQGLPASAADIDALPGSAAAAGAPASSAVARPRAAGAGPCTPDASTLCLLGGRFQAHVSWTNPDDGATAAAPSVPLSDASGYFWFFDQPNVEIALKVLDGTAVNGHFWVFYASLSDVAYTVTVTDLQTGDERVYRNGSGQLASVADTGAF